MGIHVTRRHFLQQMCAGASVALPHLSRQPFFTTGVIPSSSLSFRYEPLIDLYFLLRKEIGRGATLPAAWSPVLDRMRDAADDLPGGPGLRLMDGIIAEHRSTSELSQTIERMPEERMPETGAGVVPLRAILRSIADALQTAESLYAEGIGPTQRAIVEEARRNRIDAVLRPKERDCLSFLLSGLEIPDPSFSIPVFLVAGAPEPGSLTSRSRLLKAVCFVSVVPYPGSSLLEVILHEATHALEVAAGPDTDSVLDRLRRELQARGVRSSDPLFRDVPHTLMFVHSGEAVRRLLDPAHVHYGDSHGYYAKLPTVAQVVRRNWMDHLNGQTSANVAIERIAFGVKRKLK